MKTTARQIFYDIARQMFRTPDEMESWVERKLDKCILQEWDDEVIIGYNHVGVKDKEFDCPPIVLYLEWSNYWSVYATNTIKNLKENIISALNNNNISELKVFFQGKPINVKILHYYIVDGRKENPILKYGDFNIYDDEDKAILVEIEDIIEVEDTEGNKGYFKSFQDVGNYLCGLLGLQMDEWYIEKLKQEKDKEKVKLYKIRVNNYDYVFNITDDGFIDWVGQNPRIDENAEKFPENVVLINLLSQEIEKLLIENNVEFEVDIENCNFKVSNGSIDISNYVITNKTEKDWM